MDIELAIGVMTVPERRAHLARLVARIGGAVHVYIDHEHKGCWPAWLGAWRACETAQPSATHIAILADDIAICADLRETLAALVAARPLSSLGGWLPRDQVDMAHAQGMRWASTRRLQFVQLLVLPRELGLAALDWIAAHEHRLGDLWGSWDDERLRAFTAAHNLASYVPVPNICDHLGGDGRIASTFGHVFARESSCARVWLGEHGQGAMLDWSDLRCVGDQTPHPYAAPRLLLTPYNATAAELGDLARHIP